MNPERLRFAYEDDLTLLREVISQNPFQDGERWKTILKNVIAVSRKDFTLRAIREHTKYLIKNWNKFNRENLNR